MKKTLTLILAALMCLSALTACGGGGGTTETEPPATEGTQPVATQPPASEPETEAIEIYFLNFKPEIAEVYTEIAAAYEAETGVKVKVETAAAGTYEQTLRSEIAKTDAPTIFQINGPVGLQNWKEYCADLSGTQLYEMLSDKSLAVTEGDAVYGVPYAVEGYGIIYNDAIVQKYFALGGALFTSMDQVNNFAKLKSLVEDMQEKKDELGIEGVFASTSMLAGEQWRWQTHLANIPFYYEFSNIEGYESSVLAGLDAEVVNFTQGEYFKNIFDLYTDNSVSAKGLLGTVSVNDSMSEFALGKCAMVQNGNWGAGQILGAEGNTVAEEDIKFLPIYTGVEGEETQGLCVGTENYFCINAEASPEKQQASIDFIVWLFSSDAGKAFVKDKLGFIAPFNTFAEDEKPTDPLAREMLAWMEKGDVQSVPWTFVSFPGEAFKDYVGNALLEYLQGSLTWEEVETIVKDSWASEKALAG